MRLPEALQAYVTSGVRTTDMPNITLAQFVASAEGRYGGRKAARAALGVSDSTWRRWRTGRVRSMSAASRARVTRAINSTASIANVRSGSIVVEGEIRVSSDTRNRKIDRLSDYIPSSVWGKVADHLDAGQYASAASELESAVAEFYCADMEFIDVEVSDG